MSMTEREQREYREYMVSVHAARDAWETLRDESRAEGRAEGLAEGRAEEKLANARSLKENGVPVDIIAKSLGLTVEEINSCRA